MAKLGFLGLGIMGYPMARNLIQAGHDVGLVAHVRKARELAGSAGGRFCATPADAAAEAECVFLCVGDSQMSEEADSRARTASRQGQEGARWWWTPAPYRLLSSRANRCEAGQEGFHFLDAPCTGSKPGAEGGTLTFMIGGDKEVFERVRPYFEADG